MTKCGADLNSDKMQRGSEPKILNIKYNRVSLVICCGYTVGSLHLTGPLFICVSLRNLKIQRAHSASISRIDLRARRRSAVDPQTNTYGSVVPQDLTGRQWIPKIQRACNKSAKSIYGRARSRSSVDPRTDTCKTVDP